MEVIALDINESYWDYFYRNWSSYNYSYEEYYDIPTVCTEGITISKLVLNIIFVLVLFVNLLGNGFVLFTFMWYKVLNKASDVYIYSLTIVDLMAGLYLIVILIVNAIPNALTSGTCKFITLLLELHVYCGMLLTVVISLDRFLAIKCPSNLNYHSKKHGIITVVICGVIAMCLSVPHVIYSTIVESHKGDTVCYTSFGANTQTLRINLKVVGHFFGFIIPFVILMFLYLFSVIKLCKLKFQRRYRAMGVLLIIVGVFVICWLPHHIVNILDTLMRLGYIRETCKLRNVITVGIFITHTIGLIHSCLNPILYAVFGSVFRKKAVSVLTGGCSRTSSSST